MARAQAAPANSAQLAESRGFDKSISDIRQQVSGWKASAHTQVALVLAVFIFGGLISGFHATDNKWGKKTVLVLGIATSIVTAINGSGQVFSADYRALRVAVSEANRVVTRLDRINATPNIATMNGSDFAVIKAEFDAELDVFDKIAQRVEGPGAGDANASGSILMSSFSLSAVEAQSAGVAPAWVQKLPSDNRNLYFVGKNTDTSLSKAKANSYADGANRIAQAFGGGEPYTSTPARESLIQNASVVQDTFFTFDSGTSSYTYFTLLRVSRDLLSTPLEFKQKDWYPIDLTFDPSAGLLVLDREGGVAKIQVDAGAIHLQPLFHLPPTARVTAITSTSDSAFVSTSNKAGCVVFRYSFASKRMTQKRVAPDPCDDIANDGQGIFLAFSKQDEIRYWPDLSAPAFQTFSFPEIPGATRYCILGYDKFAHRLIYAGASGSSYALSLPAGKWSELASGVGYVHAIATDASRVLFASGNKILFYDKNNRWQPPPPSMKSLKGATIYGVAVDSSDSAWIADHDNSTVRGPFPLD
jgi:hypothetical protein